MLQSTKILWCRVAQSGTAVLFCTRMCLMSKTKSLTIAKNNIKCEIKLKGTTIEQVQKFNYLGVEISAKRDLKQEVKMQTTKAARISGCLYNLIWLNKYMSTDCKVRIYKTNVRPVLTYASETRAETTYTQ